MRCFQWNHHRFGQQWMRKHRSGKFVIRTQFHSADTARSDYRTHICSTRLNRSYLQHHICYGCNVIHVDRSCKLCHHIRTGNNLHHRGLFQLQCRKRKHQRYGGKCMCCGKSGPHISGYCHYNGITYAGINHWFANTGSGTNERHLFDFISCWSKFIHMVLFRHRSQHHFGTRHHFHHGELRLRFHKREHQRDSQQRMCSHKRIAKFGDYSWEYACNSRVNFRFTGADFRTNRNPLFNISNCRCYIIHMDRFKRRNDHFRTRNIVHSR